MARIKDLQKYINLTGERAKLDAKANGTYVVYKNHKGQLVKEYIDGATKSVEGEKQLDV